MDKTIVIEENSELEYSRVDFTNQETIIHYGHEIKDKIVELFKSVTSSSIDYQELSIDEETISSIESFNDVLEESDKELEKKQKSLGFKTKLFLTKIGVKGLDVELKTSSYKEQYEDYLEKIEKSKQIVETLKMGAIEDAKTRKQLAEIIILYLEKLKEIIEVGMQDREVFAIEIDNDKKELRTLKIDPTLYDEQKIMDLEHTIQVKLELLGLFDNRLNDLQQNLIVYKETRQSFLLQQKNEFQILLAAEAYLKDVITVLETQASIHIFNRKQQIRTQIIDRLTQAGNTAIKRDAVLLQQNITAVAQLTLNKGIYTSTTEAIHVSLHESLKLYIQGREAKRLQIINDEKAIQAINASIDEEMEAITHADGELGIMSDVTVDNSLTYNQPKGLILKKKK